MDRRRQAPILLMGATQKQIFSTFTGIATQYQEPKGKAATVIGAVDRYVSDFGTFNAMASRFVRGREIEVVDPSLWRQLRFLSHFHLSEADRKTIQSAYKTLRTYLGDHKNLNDLSQAFAHLKDLRNQVAHCPATLSDPPPLRPAYTLDEDDDV